MTSKQKIYGKNSINECLDSDIPVFKIWMAKSSNPKLKDIEAKAKAKQIPIDKLDKAELDELADNPKSIIAEIAAPQVHGEDYLLQESINKVLIAVNIEDPHNLGAIIRTAYAFGMDAVVIAKHKSVGITDSVVHISAGAALKLPIVQVTNIVNTLEKLKANQFWSYATVANKDNSQSLYQTEFDPKSVILVGNEGKGLSDNILKHCDFKLYIPIEFESLNVSVTTGIILSKIYTDEA